jgi:hypothetical protein
MNWFKRHFIVLCLLFFFQTNSYASSHEHLVYLPNYEDILFGLTNLDIESDEYKEALIDQRKMKDLVKARERILFSNSDFSYKFRQYLEQNIRNLARLINAKTGIELTHQSIYETLSATYSRPINEVLYDLNLKYSDFLTLPEGVDSITDGQKESTKSWYIEITKYRNEVFLMAESWEKKARIGFVTKPFEFYARRTHSELRKPIVFTTATNAHSTAFNPTRLRTIFNVLQNTDLRQNEPDLSTVLFSITKGVLGGPEDKWKVHFSEAKEFVTMFQNAGFKTGIDVVGSIQESNRGTKETEDKILLRMNAILNFLQELNTQKNTIEFRFHGFESNNRGPFYDALKRLLSGSHPFTGTIRIGHIAALDIADIAFFHGLLWRDRIVFDANLFSNLSVTPTTLEQLLRTIWELEMRGLRVELGTDGAGILNFELVDQLCYLFQKLKPEHMSIIVNIAVRAFSGLTKAAVLEKALNNKCMGVTRTIHFKKEKLGSYLYPYLKQNTEYCAAQLIRSPPELRVEN